jgi:subtilase family serine protease
MATKKNSTNLPDGRVALKGSERPRPATSKLVGELRSQEQLWVIMRVRQRPGSPPLPGHEYYMTHRPGQRKVYSIEEFTKTFGAAQADLDAVAGFAKNHGMSVIESHAGKRHVIISGTAGQINKAFGITLKKYEAPVPKAPQRVKNKGKSKSATKAAEAKRMYTHHGFDGTAQLPAELDTIVTAIIGLANHRLGYHAAGTGDPTSNPPYLTSAQLSQYYNFPKTGAVGQTVGVFADAADGAAYLPDNYTGPGKPGDITNYITNLPAGYNTQPVIHDVNLTISGTTYSNNPALVSVSNNQSLELAIDICTVAGISQGATINVYFTEYAESGWYTFLQEAMFPSLGETAPSALTSSWLYLDDSAATIGDYTKTGSNMANLTTVFQQAAAMGVTVFGASGDWGADNRNLDRNAHVSYPASDPWVTACGGTIIGFNGAATWTPANAGPEWVWSDAQGVGEFGGSGFGVADFGATRYLPQMRSTRQVTPAHTRPQPETGGYPMWLPWPRITIFILPAPLIR